MKQISGIWLPDGDRHFADSLMTSEQVGGAGTYQLKKLRAALAVTKGRRTALDIGAHVGLWSRVLAMEFDKVIAVEPLPELAECFRANMSDRGNVRLIEAAASDESGEFMIEPAADNSGNGRIAVEPSASAIRVPAIRLDDLDLQQIDFIKIDVEGWELHALWGAEEIIKRDKPIIVIEQKPDNAERYGLDRFSASNLLKKSWGAVQLWEKAGDYCFGWTN